MTDMKRVGFLPYWEEILPQYEKLKSEPFLEKEALEEFEQNFFEGLFGIFGTALMNILAEIAPYDVSQTTEDYYKGCIEPMLKDGRLKNMYQEKYPVMDFQIREYCRLFLLHIEEVLSAIRTELPRHYGFFFNGDETSHLVKKITAGASDRHNGGKSVHIIYFSNGRRVVYKPHSLAVGRAFDDFLTEIYKLSYGIPYIKVKSVDTFHGSFAEFVEAHEVSAPEEIGEYFENLGFVTGVALYLQGYDLHAENILACGKYPVIIDTETIISPENSIKGRLMPVKRQMNINEMCILPMTNNVPGFKKSSFSAFDNLPKGCHNLPVYEGKVYSGDNYVTEFTHGFEKAAWTLIDNREYVETRYRELFEGVEIRDVVKATSLYTKFLSFLAEKNCLEDWETYDRRFEVLHIKDDVDENLKKMVFEAEKEAMKRLDVPYFKEILHVENYPVMSREMIEDSVQRTAYSVNKKAPNFGMDKELCRESLKGDSFLEVLDALAGVVEKRITPSVVTCEMDSFVISSGASAAVGALDGSFGALIALCAYSVATGDDKYKELLNRSLSAFKDQRLTSATLTARFMGLCDGTAGYLLGSALLYEMGYFDSELFNEILKKIGSLSEEALKIKYSSTDILYGQTGMLFAIKRAKKAGAGEILTPLYKCILGNLSEDNEYKGLTEKEILDKIKLSIIRCECADRKYVSQNNSLRFGNAGSLYLLAGKMSPEDEKRREALMEALTHSNSVIIGNEVPKSVCECGLIHGMAGVVFSVISNRYPGRIPDLFL